MTNGNCESPVEVGQPVPSGNELNPEHTHRRTSPYSDGCASWLQRVPAYSCLSFVLGTVLLAAAALKGHQLITGYVPGKTLLTSWTFQLLTIEVELALGIWLVSGFYKRYAARVALGYFVILAGASAYLVTAAAECCGCLGRLAISPWFTLVFDLAAISSLLLCPLSKERSTDGFSSKPYLATSLIAGCCFLGLFLLVAAPDRYVASTLDGNRGQDGDLVVLDVENWQGKRLPVLDYLDIGPRLGAGRWMLILYHSDCPRCDDAITKEDGTVRDGDLGLALVQVPRSTGLAGEPRLTLRKPFVLGSLSPSRRWVVVTPVVLTLENGIVTHVQGGSAETTGAAP
jgi:hypothetical protein